MTYKAVICYSQKILNKLIISIVLLWQGANHLEQETECQSLSMSDKHPDLIKLSGEILYEVMDPP